MNKSFLVSSAVMIAAAVLGYWIVADPGGGTIRKSRSHVPVASESDAAPLETPTSIPGREIVEFIGISHVFEDGAGDALDLQTLLDSVAMEYLPPPRVVTPDWLPDAGEEQSSPPDGLTLLLRQGYRLAAYKCAELVAKIEPLIGSEQFWGKMNQVGGAVDAPANDGK